LIEHAKNKLDHVNLKKYLNHQSHPDDGLNALCAAASIDKQDIVSILKNAGARYTATSAALKYAVEKRDAKLLNALLKISKSRYEHIPGLILDVVKKAGMVVCIR
jgi:hypothetical protein